MAGSDSTHGGEHWMECNSTLNVSATSPPLMRYLTHLELAEGCGEHTNTLIVRSCQGRPLLPQSRGHRMLLNMYIMRSILKYIPASMGLGVSVRGLG
jgi:hypothetical protein